MVSYLIQAVENNVRVIDVILRTDASEPGREFLITDVEGLGADEVRRGVDYTVGYTNEGDLIEMSRDNNWFLYSFDAVRQRRLLVLATPDVGFFNGENAYALAADVPLTDGTGIPDPTTFSVEYCISTDDLRLISLTDSREANFFSVDCSNSPFISIYMDDVILDPMTQVYSATFYATIGTNAATITMQATIDDMTPFSNQFIPMEAVFNRDGSGTFSIGGQQMATSAAGTAVTGTGMADIAIGAYPLDIGSGMVRYENFFRGALRNLVLDLDGTEFLNVPNLFNGTNNGTGADLTIVNITGRQ